MKFVYTFKENVVKRHNIEFIKRQAADVVRNRRGLDENEPLGMNYSALNKFSNDDLFTTIEASKLINTIANYHN